MKTPNTDAAIKKWLEEAPAPQRPQERVEIFLKECTQEAYKAKDMSLLPSSTEVQKGAHCGGHSVTAVVLKEMGATPVTHKNRTRWALL